MSDDRPQWREWAGGEGIAYTKRNPGTVADMNDLKEATYGKTQEEIHRELLSGVPRMSNLLEVGTNVGIQLEILRSLGFQRLTGVDVSRYAISKGRAQFPELELLLATGSRLPFDDEAFDLAFTVGTLVAVPPDEIGTIVDEIVRVSERYVYGIEFYADEYTRIENRGLYWKTDFVDRFQSRHGLKIVRQEYLNYLDEDVIDIAYLLEK